MTRPQIEQFSDELDRASAIEMEATESAISEIQHRCRRDQEPREDGTYAVLDCDECGNEIGEGRLKAAIKNRLCIGCANARERRR